MDANKNRNKFYTNLTLGIGLTVLSCVSAYEFSNIVMMSGTKNYIASVNGRYITPTELKERMNTVKMQYSTQMGTDFKTENGQKTYYDLRKQVMQELIFTKIMLANAEQEKIVVTDDTVNEEIKKIKIQNFKNNESEFRKVLRKSNIKEADLSRLLKEKLTLQRYVEKLFNDNIKISDKDLRTTYETKKKDFSVPESVQASHILVKTEAEAKKIEEELKAGKDFSQLAQQYSLDPGSKVKGGDLGFFGKGMMVPEFEKAAESLQIGQVSGPVKTSFGYHIIKKTGYRPAKILAFEEVKTNLEQQLKADKQKEFFTKWRDKTLKEADVKYNKGYESFTIADKKEEVIPEANSAPGDEKSKPADSAKDAATPNSAQSDASATKDVKTEQADTSEKPADNKDAEPAEGKK